MYTAEFQGKGRYVLSREGMVVGHVGVLMGGWVARRVAAKGHRLPKVTYSTAAEAAKECWSAEAAQAIIEAAYPVRSGNHYELRLTDIPP
jgi:hypothetical protein